jgi:hypothetical protein
MANDPGRAVLPARDRPYKQLGRPRCEVEREGAFDVVTEESAYWVGFLMADGCISRNHGRRALVILNLAGIDIDHVARFRDFVGSSAPIHLSDRKPGSLNGRPITGGTTARVAVRSDRLAEALGRFGVVPAKTYTARIIGLEDDRHFWRGVVDGDGTVGIDGHWPRISLVGSASLVDQFEDFIRTNCPTSKATSHSRGKYHSIQLQAGPAYEIIKNLYEHNSISLPRKQAVVDKILAEDYQDLRLKFDWSDIDLLQRLRGEHGTWRAVARVLGISENHLYVRIRGFKKAGKF